MTTALRHGSVRFGSVRLCVSVAVFCWLIATKDPGQTTFSFTIGRGQVIKGWDEGVLTMAKGETARLTCTPDYAYGSGGFPAWGIMPNSTLVFEIELLGSK